MAVIAIGMATCLIVLTSNLRWMSIELKNSVESVRLAQEAEVDLLLHERSEDVVVDAEIEHDLRAKLDAARSHVNSPDEGLILDNARVAVVKYLEVAGSPKGSPPDVNALLDDAYTGLDKLVGINLEQSQRTQSTAATRSWVFTFLGLGAAGCFLVMAVTLFWWLGRALRPLLALAGAMERFAGGDHGARAEETGAAELREMSRRFNQMASSLEGQRNAQMAFLGGVAHDLRTPLSALKTSLAILAPERPLPDESLVRNALALVQRQIQRLERMVGDLLDTALLEAGEINLRLEESDLRELAGSAVELFRSSSPAHRLELAVPAQPALVQCDAARLEQVINNLLSNAIKYSPGGGDVLVAVELQTAKALVSVTDQGLGIHPDEQKRIFEPFARAQKGMMSISGAGLGLFVARRIVEAHGGDIRVASAPEKGTTFAVALPRARSESLS